MDDRAALAGILYVLNGHSMGRPAPQELGFGRGMKISGPRMASVAIGCGRCLCAYHFSASFAAAQMCATCLLSEQSRVERRHSISVARIPRRTGPPDHNALAADLVNEASHGLRESAWLAYLVGQDHLITTRSPLTS